MANENPFKESSQRHALFETLSDLKWHCANCELPGSQPAATVRDLRRMGYHIETAARKGGNVPARFCERCGNIRTHYRLKDIKAIHSPKERSNLPGWLIDRILNFYDNREAITGRKKHPKELTVDHKVPNIRWKNSEESFSKTITDEEIAEKFQLLTNEDNLWKSRKCEKCLETGRRQAFLGIDYFFIGNDKFNDVVGCEGCGWHNPRKWKQRLNKYLIKLSEGD